MTSFLGLLLPTLEQSILDYKAYLAAGKTFRFACVLKENNRKALQLLQEHKHQLPGTLQADAAALIEHYIVWTDKWEELADELNPGPDDEFVFPNTVTFPRDAARRLEDFYNTLKT